MNYSYSINKTSINSLQELLEIAPDNQVIIDNLVIAWNKINSPKYKKILVCISGGSDSDLVMQICKLCDKDHKCTYVTFDTGLEMDATKEHIRFLSEKYGEKIEIYKAVKPIPWTCNHVGLPFISKEVSEMIERLQKHGFGWEDDELEVLLERYCNKASGELLNQLENIMSVTGEQSIKIGNKQWVYRYGHWYNGVVNGLDWWKNMNESPKLNVNYNKFLKEFLMENPPEKYGLRISGKCCDNAKKKPGKRVEKEGNFDLKILGLRKAEGGLRSVAVKSCFSEKDGKADVYRPVFFYLNSDKQEFEKHFDVTHSRCYTEYGMCRTGCSACPFGDYEKELEILKDYEPKLYKAAVSVFGDSYKYTDAYKVFRKNKEIELEQKQIIDMEVSEGSLSLFSMFKIEYKLVN